LRAKKKGLIATVRPVLEALSAAGMFLSDDLWAAVLAEAEE
jgi:predicted nucleic acid-binding protein